MESAMICDTARLRNHLWFEGIMYQGAWSALVGIAANASIESGGPIRLADLAGDIDKPDQEPAPFGPDRSWRPFNASHYPFMAGVRPLS